MKIKFFSIAFALCLCAIAGPDMTLVSGDYKIVFDIGEKAKCSIVQIFYKDVEIGTRTGWYGTVFCPASGKYIGAGHTEGGSEAPLEKKLIIDGKEQPLQEGTFQGNDILLHKTTTLANLKLEASWKLSPEGLYIEKQFTATADQPAHMLYLFQKCWSNKSTDWMLFKMNGGIAEGEFQTPPQKPGNDKVTWPLRAETSGFCMTQFFANEKVAHLSYFPDFSNVSGANYLWNVKGYHKQYLQIILPKVIEAGYKSQTYKMLIRGFSANDKNDWKAKATALKDELAAQWPIFPRHLEPLHGSAVTLPPSPGKQQIHKVTLRLQPDSDYDISFQISKTEGMSKSITHHHAFVGYYDKEAKKFPQLAQLATKVPFDGEFHKVQGTFHTPKTDDVLFLYIYNSHSNGTVVVKNIAVDIKQEQ